MGVMAEEGDGMTINAPRTAEETGIRRKVLEDLTLKTMYLMGELSLHDLAEHMRIGLRIVDDAFQRLRKDQLCQVTGMAGAVHRVVLTAEGKGRALEALGHKQVDDPATRDSDERWVLCRRPRVVVGGELTIEMLELQFNPVTKYYAAPAQLKANNGLLIVDDFGRQRVRPEELLNRWVAPLDRGIDFLTLAGGKKIEVPFDVLVAFATNLDPATLVDEAFLRRIQTKIRLGSVTREHFHEICGRVCAQNKLHSHHGLIEELLDTIATDLGQDLRPCYPRDIINQVCWAARYESRPAQLDRDSLAQACRTYFISPS